MCLLNNDLVINYLLSIICKNNKKVTVLVDINYNQRVLSELKERLSHFDIKQNKYDIVNINEARGMEYPVLVVLWRGSTTVNNTRSNVDMMEHCTRVTSKLYVVYKLRPYFDRITYLPVKIVEACDNK